MFLFMQNGILSWPHLYFRTWATFVYRHQLDQCWSLCNEIGTDRKLASSAYYCDLNNNRKFTGRALDFTLLVQAL